MSGDNLIRIVQVRDRTIHMTIDFGQVIMLINTVTKLSDDWIKTVQVEREYKTKSCKFLPY